MAAWLEARENIGIVLSMFTRILVTNEHMS